MHFLIYELNGLNCSFVVLSCVSTFLSHAHSLLLYVWSAVICVVCCYMCSLLLYVWFPAICVVSCYIVASCYMCSLLLYVSSAVICVVCCYMCSLLLYV